MRTSLPRQVRFTLEAWTQRLPRSLLIALGLTPADPEEAGVIRAAQVNAVVRISPYVMLASCFNAAITLVMFAVMDALRPALWIWAAVLFAMVLRFLRSSRRRRGAMQPVSARTIRRLIVNGAIFGALWGVIPAVTFPGAPRDIQLFVACLTAGMMSAGGFVLAAVPLAGMAYVAMVAAGALIALLREDSPAAFGILALLASYIAVIVVALNWSAALLVNSLLAEAQVRREVTAREEAQAQIAHAERMTALGQLSGGIAHDFNNILQVVSGCAARIYGHPENRETVVHQARRIQETVERGGAITRRLLAFARRDGLSTEPIDAAALLANLGELLAHTIGPSINIHLDVAMAQGRFMADRRQLETVILNLATNARDAMPDGGDLTVSAASVVVDADQEQPLLKAGRYVRIAVSDTGGGMDPATLARVAEPFFTTKTMGTGLGLSMAKAFAEDSGGGFLIISQPGRGTTVTLWLPEADASVEARADELAHAVDGARRRVLVVDDDEFVLDVLMNSLGDAGFVIHGAEDASSALALLDGGEEVDALIADFSMPGMNGLDLIREVQARKPDLPAILLTGHVGEVATEALGRRRPERYTLLQKPMQPARIAEQLTMLMARDVS